MDHQTILIILLVPALLIAACVSSSGGQTVHARGPANASVTIIEYSDFQCPACGVVEPVIEQVLATYPAKVRLVYKDYPLSMHTFAQKASEAAECAGAQGKYWEMHDKLFVNQDALDILDLKTYAAGLGLDTARFDGCLDSDMMASDVAADLQDGKAAGVTATPTFFVNGQKIVGAQPFSAWQALIESLP